MENWEKAQGLSQERIAYLKDKEIQLTEEGYDTEERTRRLKIAIANANKIPWNKGAKHKPETRKKITESLKKRYKNDPELIQMLKDKMVNFQHSEETKKKIRDSLQERFKEVRQRKAEERERRKEKAAEEKAARLAEKERKEKKKEEQRKKHLPAKPYQKIKEENPKQYKKMMEEKSKKISESIRKKWQDPEYRAKISDSMAVYMTRTSRVLSDETRKKLSDAAKLRHAQYPNIAKKTRQSQHKKAALRTAKALMVELFTTKQKAHALVENIHRLEKLKIHLRNDQTKLEFAEQSLTKARKVLQALEETEDSIRKNISKVIGQEGQQDIEEIISNQLALLEKESSTQNYSPTQNSGNGEDTSDSKTFELSSGGMVRSSYMDGIRRENGGSESLF